MLTWQSGILFAMNLDKGDVMFDVIDTFELTS